MENQANINRQSIMADLLFENWDNLLMLPYPFSSQTICMHKDCNQKAQKRILIQIQENVIEHDMCSTHSEMEGMCLDSLPG